MIARVHAAVNAVTAAFARHGVPKDRINSEEDYSYRSIDDVMIRLSPLLAEFKLCVLPRMLERRATSHQGQDGEVLIRVSVRVAYDLVSCEDGSSHTVEVWGEALDASDKGTAKALQSAYKYAMIQTFAIPVSGSEDADSKSPRLGRFASMAEPTEGWDQWTKDIGELLRACDSRESVKRVQDSHREMLAALQRERPVLYANVGQAISAKITDVANFGAPDAQRETSVGGAREDGGPGTQENLARTEPDERPALASKPKSVKSAKRSCSANRATASTGPDARRTELKAGRVLSDG